MRGRIISSRSGVVGSWDVHHAKPSPTPPRIDVQPGDTIDFVTDSRERTALRYVQLGRHHAPENLTTKRLSKSGNSTPGFHGPLNPPLTRWQELAQVLLMSNEFAFVD